MHQDFLIGSEPLDRVGVHKDQTDQTSFNLHPNAVFRLTETMKNLEKAVDFDIPVQDMVATIGRHNAVRQLTMEQTNSLREAAARVEEANSTRSYTDETEEIVSEPFPKRLRNDEVILKPTASPECSELERRNQEDCVAYLAWLKHELYTHFSALHSSADHGQEKEDNDRRRLYSTAKDTIIRLTGIAVSPNRMLASQLFAIIKPMLTPLHQQHPEMEPLEHTLSECVANINVVVLVLNSQLVDPLADIELRNTGDVLFPEY